MEKTHTTVHLRWTICLIIALLACMGVATAQLPAAGQPWQFEVTGFIQSFTLGGAGCAGAPTAGPLACGTIVVNNHVITVPANSVVIFPANQLGVGELFSQAPAPWNAAGLSGLALNDIPAPLTTYEADIFGNVMPPAGCAGAACGAGTYIAGMVNISQHAFNAGAGYITSIAQITNPVTGGLEMEMQVSNGTATPTRVRINDPKIAALGTGRYTAGQSPDIRFTSDPDNPTITAATGFPMCLYATDIAQCPQANRPVTNVCANGAASCFAGLFTTVTGTLAANGTRIGPGSFPDATVMAPFEVGDYITFAGNLVQDCAVGCPNGPLAGPYPTAAGAGTVIYAHTITNNIAVFTAPRTAADPVVKDPAYIRTDTSLIGTGGLIVLGAAEAVIRTRFEGMATDPSRWTHLYAIDVPQPPGTDRDYGTVGIDPGPPKGANQGRWRFRPPCAFPFGTDPNTTGKTVDKYCIMNQADSFLNDAAGNVIGPPRELRSRLEVPACPASGADPIIGIACAAGTPAVPASNAPLTNGLIPGQYHAPIATYIFPENIPGAPVVPSNFNVMKFLAQGGYATTAGSVPAGPLNPWPGLAIPGPACTNPASNPGGPYQVISGRSINLSGTVGGTGVTFAWAVTAGTLNNATTLTPTFNAPSVNVTTNVTLSLTATACGSSVTNSTTITVAPNTAPVLNVSPATTINATSGTPVSFTANGTDQNGLPLTIRVTQTAGTIVLNPNPKVCTSNNTTLSCPVSFTAPTLAVGAAPVTLTFSVVASDSSGAATTPITVTVNVAPPAGAITFVSVEYRTGLQRLIVQVNDTNPSTALKLTLAPYTTKTGGTYDPSVLGNTFTLSGGVWILDISGAAPPACGNVTGAYATPCTLPVITVNASDGGTNSSVLTRIRQ